MKPLLPVMILVNVALTGLIVAIPAASEPDVPPIGDPVPLTRASVVPVAVRGIAERPSIAEAAMFGPSGASESRSTYAPTTPPPQPGGDDLSLLGVLIIQRDDERQSVVMLLRHGRPPVVSRLTLGATLDGWKLVSATRTTVTLSGAEGATRILQVGAGAKNGAPR